MKKRVFGLALALSLLLALAVPALAAEPEPAPEPEYRLARVVIQGAEYTFTYGQGGYQPTEVLQNGVSYATASYDDAGRVTAYQDGHMSDSYVYDENGDCVQKEETVDLGDGSYTTITEYTYDEGGNCVRSEGTQTGSDGSVYTSVTEFAYDEDGNCVREEKTGANSDGSMSTEVTEYAYDKDGNRVRTEYTRTDGDEVYTEITENAYDGAGQVLNEVVTVNGEKYSESVYTYSEDSRSITKTRDNGNVFVEYETQLLDVAWNKAAYGSFSTNSCSLALKDSTGSRNLFETSCSCDGDPALTYDDNGYLVRVDGAAGNSIELAYEPVA